MSCYKMFRPLLVVLTWVCCTQAIELTFELDDNAKECFYQEIGKTVSTTLQFQVVTGGKYDVDAFMEDPDKNLIYRRVRYEKDSFTFSAHKSGVFTICFSNEFSTFSHKLVWLSLEVGEEVDLVPNNPLNVVGLMESTAQEIHSRLVNVSSFQTRHRLVEAQTRKRAEELNETVLLWSLAETAAVVLVTLAEVAILRNFFKITV